MTEQEKQDKKAKRLVKKAMENMVVLGECRCGGHLISMLNVNKSNIFDVYCMDCGSISDVRFPKAGDSYFICEGQHPIDLLCGAYKAHDRAPITDDMIETIKPSENVNEIHGNIG